MRDAFAFLMGCLVSFAVLAAPDSEDIRIIKSRFAEEKLVNASVEFANDGRIKLAGQFKDRVEVQLAFALAQQVAGVRWVAPTTPENVRYPGTEIMKSGILDVLRRTKPPTSAASTEGERYALVVGVGHFADHQIPPIENAADDAKAFFNFLATKNTKRGNLRLLLEDQATKENVSQTMRDLKDRLKPNDTVVMYFSTHGNKPNDLGNVPIILYDTRVDTKRKWIDPQTTLQDDEIKQFIEAVSPARVMVVLDVCYSGGAFAKIPGFLASTSKDLFVDESDFSTGVGQKNLSYLAGSKREQEKILIAASGPGEKSWNSQSLKQGYFTYYFIDKLKEKRDVQLAFQAAKPIVQTEVRRIVSTEQSKEVNQTPQATFIPESADLKF